MKAVLRYSFVVAHASVSSDSEMLETFNTLMADILSEVYFESMLDELGSLRVSLVSKRIIQDSFEFMISGRNEFWSTRHHYLSSLRSHLNLILLHELLKFRWQEETSAQVFNIKYWFGRTRDIDNRFHTEALGPPLDVVGTVGKHCKSKGQCT